MVEQWKAGQVPAVIEKQREAASNPSLTPAAVLLLVTLEERLPPWDRRIDLLVLTHPHEDHVAGLAHLLDDRDLFSCLAAIAAQPGDIVREFSEF